MDLSIIIVSWNVKDKLHDNLTTLFKSKIEFSYDVYVVDNNSEDGTAEMIRKDFPQVNLIDNNANLGFAKANNQVLKHLDSRFVLLLNPDMRLETDTLKNMVAWMKENPRAAVAGGRLISDAGEVIKHVRRLPTVWNQLAIILKLPHINPGILKQYIREDFDYSRPAEVDSIRGGFFMINLRMLRELKHFMDSTLPLMDEQYYLWFEEVDYCCQIKKAGGEVWYTPAARCVDLVGQSFKQLKRRTSQGYMRDSMLKYFKKWHPYWQYLVLKLAWPIGSFIAIIGEKIGVKPHAKT
ncbi:MAG: glycosyltransferase family 2 protein [Candidatus Omnitrophota bacterium]